MNFDKDEKSFLAHIFDLAKAAYARDADVFSDFLNVREFLRAYERIEISSFLRAK